MIFYGNGPIKFTMTGYNSTPRFTREFNPYSQVGCYFLTEENTPETQVTMKGMVTSSNYTNVPYCLNYVYHEKELVSLSNSGKEILCRRFMLCCG